MKPIVFSSFNQPAIAHVPNIGVMPVLTSRYSDGTPEVISCWQLSFWERIVVLVTGKLFVHTLGNATPPIKPSVGFAHVREIEQWYKTQEDDRP